jgi:hypothetical protein
VLAQQCREPLRPADQAGFLARDLAEVELDVGFKPVCELGVGLRMGTGSMRRGKVEMV